MRSTFALVLAPGLVLSIALALAGCQVGTTPPRRDGGIGGSTDVPVPPGTDAPWIPVDTGPRPDAPFAGADTDGDGISDTAEGAMGTNPLLEDSDGDGQSDGVEAVAGTDPLNPSSFIPGTDFYVVLPYGDPALHRNLDFVARLGRGDVFFLVDTTGSMGLAINNVRSSLSTVIVPAIRDAIVDVVMGVGDYRDFPVDPYGSPAAGGFAADHPFLLRQAMTADVAAVQAGLGLLAAGGGADEPESGTEGLYRAVADECGVPDGGFGAACFRHDSHPIIVLVTDAHLHNGPSPAYDYGVGVDSMGGPAPPIPGAHTWAETLSVLTSNDVHIVGVAVPVVFFNPARAELTTIATMTGSRDAMGNPTVYASMGGNVSTQVVAGITDLVGNLRQDVTSQKRDDPADGVDATNFIKAITPVSSRPTTTTFDATTFYDVPAGTTVTFDVAFMNDFVPPTDATQIFRAYIDVYDLASMTVLDTRNVYIVVPREDGILF